MFQLFGGLAWVLMGVCNWRPVLCSPLSMLLPSLPNAAKKLLDQSTRNPLIFKGVIGSASGLRHFSVGVETETIGVRRAEMWENWGWWSTGEVRKNPRQPPQTRGVPQIKTPTETRWR